MSDSTWHPRPSAGSAPASRLRVLFSEIAAGNSKALGDLYDTCGEGLYGLALWRSGSPADAADSVQEVFVRLATLRQRLEGIRDPLAYLRRMTHRAAVDVHRRRTRRREGPVELARFVEADEPSPERSAEAGRLSVLLGRLPAKQREAIYLHHICGCSHAEVGRATGVPTFTAASRCRLGLQRMRTLLEIER